MGVSEKSETASAAESGGGGGGRFRRGTSAPRRYRMGGVMPLSSPCRYQARGSSDGVSEKQ